MQITSSRNQDLQDIRRAASLGRTTEDGLIVAEGPHLIEEAIRGAWSIERILATPEALERHSGLTRQVAASVTEVSSRAFVSVATTETSQGLLALLRPPQYGWPDLAALSPALLLVLDGVQDPGNAGTIVRSAEAFGVSGIVFLSGCVRIANGKFLRATAGSILRTPFLEGVSAAELNLFAANAGWPLYALTARGKATVTSVDFKSACVIAVGAEGSGVSKDLLQVATGLSIPAAKVESLNAAVACSIALYETARQRAAR